MTNMQYSSETQRKVDATIEAEIKRSLDTPTQILRSIYEASYDKTLNETGRLTTVMGRLATLLVCLSIKADSIQNKMVWYNRIIATLTAVILFLTIVLLFK